MPDRCGCWSNDCIYIPTFPIAEAAHSQTMTIRLQAFLSIKKAYLK
jgi:hypothetical protein